MRHAQPKNESSTYVWAYSLLPACRVGEWWAYPARYRVADQMAKSADQVGGIDAASRHHFSGSFASFY